ncbi:MAG: hypothetical protein U1D06_01900, partial [Paracoccaceae bacterium]|nr:hypothetical protein [Paracoccaceae bacterium]
MKGKTTARAPGTAHAGGKSPSQPENAPRKRAPQMPLPHGKTGKPRPPHRRLTRQRNAAGAGEGIDQMPLYVSTKGLGGGGGGG